ncbi:hypothetical protein IQ218_05785 [Synechocystis salina LEGE 06099]|uniref:hypothetical protein n=1 Tax=Synechocystis salina TaxID=945780 RepID=UPI001881A5E2|nr:hypothetical protein [Synechocystis salina]MBE9203057.1 hypothetical protein [Synechocystis salina LEGE 06099]
MSAQKKEEAPKNKFITSILTFRIEVVSPYLFLLVLTWSAHFLLIKDFGLYEDDWGFTATAIANDFTQNWNRLYGAITSFWQGRPVHMALLTFIPFWGAKFGGIQTLYIIGFAILGFNTCLWFAFIRRITCSGYGALIASLFFCLYPADTTFSFLQHLFGLQTSLLCLLLAFHFYITISYSKIFTFCLKGISYLLAILSLLNYESLFLVFLTAPLFRPHQITQKQKNYHFFIVLAIGISYFLLRRWAGESRVSNMGVVNALQKIVQQITLGPLVSLGSFILRPAQVLNELLGQYWSVLLISSLLFLFILINLFNSRWGQVLRSSENPDFNSWKRWLIVGLMMTILAYPSALLLSVTAIDGRDSRVHFSASLGTTLIFTCLWILLLLTAHRWRFKQYIIISILSLQLGFLFTFCLDVQHQYRLSWQSQQTFIQDVISLAPDLQEGTTILLQAPGLVTGKQINPFDWSLPWVLESVYLFPSDWEFVPRIYRVYSETSFPTFWQEHIVNGNEFILSPNNPGLYFYFPWEPERVISGENIILLVRENDKLVRKDYIEGRSGQKIVLKPKPQSTLSPNFATTPIFDRLMASSCDHCRQGSPIYLENP